MNYLVDYLLVLTCTLLGWVGRASMRNRAELDAVRLEVHRWYSAKIRISVGGVEFITYTLEELRNQALVQLQEDGVRLDTYVDAPATCPPLVVERNAVIAATGETRRPYPGGLNGGDLTSVTLYIEGIPFPQKSELGLFYAGLSTWWPGVTSEPEGYTDRPVAW